MAGSAHVTSTDAIRQFSHAVLVFQEEARICLSTLDQQLRQIMLWLEQDRPGFWKREIEKCMQEMTGARVRLHQCRMRRMGDFRPSCIEEVKDLEKAKQQLEFAQKQIPLVKRWHAEASHESNEFRGRTSQLTQAVERDIPSLLALLAFTLQKLEDYAAVMPPGSTPAPAFITQMKQDLESLREIVQDPVQPAAEVPADQTATDT
jgi:hypothetical protein